MRLIAPKCNTLGQLCNSGIHKGIHFHTRNHSDLVLLVVQFLTTLNFHLPKQTNEKKEFSTAVSKYCFKPCERDNFISFPKKQVAGLMKL